MKFNFRSIKTTKKSRAPESSRIYIYPNEINTFFASWAAGEHKKFINPCSKVYFYCIGGGGGAGGKKMQRRIRLVC